ncbi:OmpH family outer membrane protein [Loktanella sp. F6476L]|uniref:OmpH family outer membrane protein n=1 Tax=Loktanella sp. F6476L TaxID=2926405 RepID=UPI001FF46F73|nr:OmpH family outer membrane protein [Loktanella sp. F6476L]MCK0119874.1 OmpH family outer membrane protein [Loktanella sp. F6476L]
MLRFARICSFTIAAFLGSPAMAQDQTVVLPSPIMVVDFERIFVETLYGQRISEMVSEERARVQADNDRIAAELLAEETALTEARATMNPATFRDEARAFNERAQAVRMDREAEQAKLVQLRDTERSQFLERIRPIILALMLERGAVVSMDRRAVIQAIGSANATEDAVSLIDTTLGDGSRDPSERPTLRPIGDTDGLPEVAPIIADDALELPLPQDDLPQSE